MIQEGQVRLLASIDRLLGARNKVTLGRLADERHDYAQGKAGRTAIRLDHDRFWVHGARQLFAAEHEGG